MTKIESSLVLAILLILILKDSNGILMVSEDIPALQNNSEPCESISEELPVSIASIVSIA